MRFNWIGCPLYTGVFGVPVQQALGSWTFNWMISGHSVHLLISPYQPFRWPFLTMPHQGFIFIHPSNFSLARLHFRLNASLGFTFRFTHHRYQQCMGMLGTALDTKPEETAPHSSNGSFICRGFQPFVRHRVAPKTGNLYALGINSASETLVL